jgi:hypothetical protein
LNYKKERNKKMATLNAIFKQVYGEGLSPHGFVKIKGRQPYFVRVVEGGEIIHVITYVIEPSGAAFKEYLVMGGVATVYRPLIDLTINPNRNSNWLRSNLSIHSKLNPFDDDSDLSDRIYRFHYGKDEESMLNEVKFSLEITKKIMLPLLDKMTDFEKCIEYNEIIGMNINVYDDENFGTDYYSNFYNEGLLLIKTDNHDDFIKKKQKDIDIIEYNKKMGRGPIPSERIFELLEEGRIERIRKRDNVYNNPELYKKALSELEKRKAANTATLRSYGLEL